MRTAVGLAKGLENQFLLMGGNSDSGIAHGEGDRVRRTGGGEQRHLSFVGELQRVGQQIAQHLAKALRIRLKLLRRAGLQVAKEREPFLTGERRECLNETLEGTRHDNRLGHDLQLARLDARQIEDVVDEGEQLLAGG